MRGASRYLEAGLRPGGRRASPRDFSRFAQISRLSATLVHLPGNGLTLALPRPPRVSPQLSRSYTDYINYMQLDMPWLLFLICVGAVGASVFIAMILIKLRGWLQKSGTTSGEKPLLRREAEPQHETQHPHWRIKYWQNKYWQLQLYWLLLWLQPRYRDGQNAGTEESHFEEGTPPEPAAPLPLLLSLPLPPKPPPAAALGAHSTPPPLEEMWSVSFDFCARSAARQHGSQMGRGWLHMQVLSFLRNVHRV